MEQRCFFSSSAFICSLPIGLLVFGKIIYMKHQFVVNMNKLLICDVYISAMWIRFNCFSCCRYSIGNSDLLNGITYGWLYTLSQINKAPYTYTISRNIHSFNYLFLILFLSDCLNYDFPEKKNMFGNRGSI